MEPTLHTTGWGSRGHIKVKRCPKCGSIDIEYLKGQLARCGKCGHLRNKHAFENGRTFIETG